jgi:ketosteroid isomerase-like protein
MKETTMKPFSLLVLIGALLIGCKPPEQFDVAAVKAKIEAGNKGYTQALLKGDATAAAGYWDENAVSLSSNMPMVRGRAAIEKGLTVLIQSGMKYKEFTTTTISVEGAGDIAVELGRAFLTFEMNGRVIADTVKYLTVWKKQADASWKIAYDSPSTDIPAPAIPPEPESNKK